MEEYEKLLNSLIADYKQDKKSKERNGALAALYEAKKLLKILKNKSVQS